MLRTHYIVYYMTVPLKLYEGGLYMRTALLTAHTKGVYNIAQVFIIPALLLNIEQSFVLKLAIHHASLDVKPIVIKRVVQLVEGTLKITV